MAINGVVQYNGRFLRDILLLTQAPVVVWFDEIIMVQVYYCHLFNYVLRCLLFCCVWWPGIAINVSIQYYGVSLPDIILLTQSYYLRGTHLNAMEGVLYF